MGKLLTPGRLLFDDIVPEQFRQDVPYDKPIGSDTIKNILQQVAEHAPEKYKDISHKLLKFGAKTSTETPTSFGLDDLRSPIDKKPYIAKLEAQEAAISARKDLTDEQKEDERVKLYENLSHTFPDKVYDAAYAMDSNLAHMVASGARGNRGQLNSNVGADWLIMDNKGDPVPIPVKNSYAEGLSPAEYFAGAFGTRAGLISTKFAVAESGYLAKQLSAAAHDMVVSSNDCETDRGIPTTPDDKDNIGATLAKPIGGYPANTTITSRVLSDLKHKKVENLMVRSPITCTARGGVCALCAGVRERNHLPKLMDNLGLAASSSISEPLSQGLLSAKHSAGVASSTGRTATGFKSVDQLVQVPETFEGGATLSGHDGRITKIEPAPQGGNFVHVGTEKHYVPQEAKMLVKVGDEVEAGDVLTDGTPNPAEIVKHKGIGQGRMYFVQAMANAFKNNNLQVNRRNLEILSRSLVNHVKITNPEGMGDHLPDDVVEYNAMEQGYHPENFKTLAPEKAVGSFLQKPALYFSIGTRVTPKVSKILKDHGEKEVHVGDQQLGFEPEMQRVMDIPGFKQDWMSQFHGSYLRKRLLQNVHSGDATSDIHGSSYVPGLAKGVEFGKPPKDSVGY